MKRKLYISPILFVEPLACVQTILWVSKGGGGEPEPGAPERKESGDKLGKMYI